MQTMAEDEGKLDAELVRQFAASANIEVMIINIDAFKRRRTSSTRPRTS